MKILEKSEEGNVLKLVVDTNEEALLFLLKSFLEKEADVDIVGVHKEHHLIDKTEFYLKTKKGNPLTLFKKSLKSIKKEVQNLKI